MANNLEISRVVALLTEQFKAGIKKKSFLRSIVSEHRSEVPV